MKRLLFLTLLLVSCVPQVTFVDTPPPGATLTYEQFDGYVTVTVTTETPLDRVDLTFAGEFLGYNDPSCSGGAQLIECTALDVSEVYATSISGDIQEYVARACIGLTCYRLRLE